ncbi:MAG: retropepsin-like aspartic protease [bacterium]|nr:retropepsin-like aspartic protease [bacterium]
MKYKFSVVAGQTNIDGHYTKRPIVEVELSKGKQTRKFLALIDSGADQITMPAAIAEVLGIEREKCPKRSAVGISMERTEGFIGELDFHIRNQTETFKAPVVFIDTDVPVLLGREGFFNRFRIKFEQDHDTFEITPAPKR